LHAFRGKGVPQGSQQAASPPRADQAPTAPGQAADKDYGWIVKAMAECEEEAKQKLDTLHFLIIPVIGTGMSLPGWSPNPISDVGTSATLLT
jgi:hypothetical protein